MNNSNDRNRGNRGREDDQMGAKDNLDTNQQASSSARDTEEESGNMGRDES